MEGLATVDTVYLAVALEALVRCLVDVGRHHEALGRARELVELYRGLAAHDSGNCEHLARALERLATILTAVDDHDAAAEATREVASNREYLGKRGPARIRQRTNDRCPKRT